MPVVKGPLIFIHMGIRSRNNMAYIIDGFHPLRADRSLIIRILAKLGLQFPQKRLKGLLVYSRTDNDKLISSNPIEVSILKYHLHSSGTLD